MSSPTPPPRRKSSSGHWGCQLVRSLLQVCCFLLLLLNQVGMYYQQVCRKIYHRCTMKGASLAWLVVVHVNTTCWNVWLVVVHVHVNTTCCRGILVLMTCIPHRDISLGYNDEVAVIWLIYWWLWWCMSFATFFMHQMTSRVDTTRANLIHCYY